MAVKLSRDCDLRLNVSDSTVILPWSFLDVRSFEEEGENLSILTSSCVLVLHTEYKTTFSKHDLNS